MGNAIDNSKDEPDTVTLAHFNTPLRSEHNSMVIGIRSY